jgi:predicted house-cleaning NTP pyrophosphatase (Maf/HAM1 superfamily)
MTTFIDKARDWRRRAAELRRLAERMMTSVTRTSLLDRAASLEHHAANLEQITVKFRHIHEAAADTRPLDAYIWRPRMPIPQEGDCRTASS